MSNRDALHRLDSALGDPEVADDDVPQLLTCRGAPLPFELDGTFVVMTAQKILLHLVGLSL